MNTYLDVMIVGVRPHHIRIQIFETASNLLNLNDFILWFLALTFWFLDSDQSRNHNNV